MSTIELGPLTLHTNAIGWQPVTANSFSQSKDEGLAYPATVTGPGGLEIDVALFMSHEGQGMVHCPDAAGVPADYARLAHGARLGVYVEDEETWIIKQLRLLRFSAASGWGNPRMTSLQELNEVIGASFVNLLRNLGDVEIGTKCEVLGITGNDIAMRWATTAGPELPLVAYSATRILPIFTEIN